MAGIVGIIVCIALVAGLFIVVYRTLRKIDKVGWENLDNYDERQILSRGKAFQAGFFVVICLSIIFAILTSVFNTMRVFAPNFLFIAAFAGITVFNIIAIWTDSFATDKFQAGKFFALFFMVGVANLAVWIMDKDWNTVGEFLSSDNLVSFLIGVSFTITAILIAVKTIKQKREENK